MDKNMSQYQEKIKENINLLINQNKLNEAKEVLSQYESIVSNDTDVYSTKAVIYMMEGNIEQAEQVLVEGLNASKGNFDLLYNLAYLYQSKGQTELAIEYYKKAFLNAKAEEDRDSVYEILQELGIQETKQELLKNKVPKTSIVILTYNNLEYNKLCIESIRQFTESGTYEIIAVDNHSTDGTVEWLKEQKDLKLVLNDENQGFPKGCNQGIYAAVEDNDILLLNNDTVVAPNWLNNLKTCLYSDETIGAVGAVTNNCSYYQAIPVDYKSIDEMIKFAEAFNISDSEKWEQRIKLVGYCMLIKRSVLNKIGLLDERFTPGNFEDDDLSFRIQRAGFRLMLCKDTFIHHFGSLSFSKDTGNFISLLNRNSDKFKEKWGFRSEYSCFIRTEITNLIDEPRDKAMNILEVGCACGATLLKIKQLYKNANLYGIELDDAAAKIAESFADVRAENIEKASLSYDAEYFDYIIFADVLEHLYDPWKVLNDMKRYLKPNGKILASVPNVMHISVIKDLLNGSWSYQDAGILDKTHVRFFTLNEIDKMFKGAGYSNLDYTYNVMPLPEEDKKLIAGLTKLSAKESRQKFEAYQYIVKAVKNEEVNKLDIQKVTVLNKDNVKSLLQDNTQYIKSDKDLITVLLRRLENNLDIEENLAKLVELVSQNHSCLEDSEILCGIQSFLNNTELTEQNVKLAELKTLIRGNA